MNTSDINEALKKQNQELIETNAKLVKENARLVSENQKLKSEPPDPPVLKRNLGLGLKRQPM